MQMTRWILTGLLAGTALAGGRVAAEEAATAASGPLVREVRLTGVTQIDPDRLRSLLKTQAGKPFDADILENDLLELESFYHRNGYPLALVKSGYGIDEAGVVTIPMDEGRIEKVVVKGNKKTRAHVITRELSGGPGGVYSAKAIAEARKRLYSLGLFNSVSIAPTAGSEPGDAILTIDVNERATGNFSAAMGYTNTAGLVGFGEWSDSNFLGTGQTLAINWQRGAYASYLSFDSDGELSAESRIRSGYDLGYYMPWVLRRGFSAGARLYDTATQQFFYFSQDVDSDNLRNYEWRQGVLFTLGRQLSNGMTLGLLGRHDNVDFGVAPVNLLPPPGETIAPTKVTSIRLSMSRGSFTPFTVQDNTPHNGLFLELGQASVLGTQSNYQKYGLVTTHYLPVSNRDTIAARLQAGWSSGNVPYSELYLVGGPHTVRSYTWSKFQGTRMLVLNTELRHRLKEGLTASAFVDMGYAWPRNTGFRISDLRPAVGLGFRMVTPFGPVRLDYAMGQDGGRFHLSTGDYF